MYFARKTKGRFFDNNKYNNSENQIHIFNTKNIRIIFSHIQNLFEIIFMFQS